MAREPNMEDAPYRVFKAPKKKKKKMVKRPTNS